MQPLQRSLFHGQPLPRSHCSTLPCGCARKTRSGCVRKASAALARTAVDSAAAAWAAESAAVACSGASAARVGRGVGECRHLCARSDHFFRCRCLLLLLAVLEGWCWWRSRWAEHRSFGTQKLALPRTRRGDSSCCRAKIHETRLRQ